MANKYLEHDGAGGVKQVEATVTSAGAGDDGKIVALDNTGRLDETMMPVGIGADTASLVASEILQAGDWVNVWNDTTAKVRKADAATAGKEVSGFVLSGVASAGTALVYFEGINTQVTSMTPGSIVFLSASSPGIGTHTAPSSSGNIVQKIGRAISATSVSFEGSNPIELV